MGNVLTPLSLGEVTRTKHLVHHGGVKEGLSGAEAQR